MWSEQCQTDCFIGLDLGTSGCRAIAIDETHRVVGQARRPLPPSRQPGAGASEQDPQAWWRAVTAMLRELVQQRPGRVRAISVDGTSSTLLLCDAAGSPISPAMMYDDRRSTRQAARIAQIAPPDSPARGPGSALAKLLYLLESGYGADRARALHQADWIAARLTGRVGLADENNALKLGYDPLARRWPDWLAGLRLRTGLLPDVRPVGSVYGRIDARIAARLDLSEDTLIVAGTTDSNAATLAAGISRSGDAVTSLGSTLVLKIFAQHPIAAARYGVYSHRIGAVLRRFFNDTQLSRLSRDIDPTHSPGLHYYPLPSAGERFPRNNPQMQPRMQPRPASDREFLHGLLEGIADIEAEGYWRLAELGAPLPQRVFTSGGGAVNETWRQIRQRRLGVPVRRAQHTEAAFGAALLARAAVLQPPRPDP